MQTHQLFIPRHSLWQRRVIIVEGQATTAAILLF